MRASILPRSCNCLGLLAALAMLPATLSATTENHLSPAGKDSNPGTRDQPVATPQGAQVRVRALIRAGLTDAVDVILAAGDQVMNVPLELEPEDSGTGKFPITWKAAPGAKVVWSGGLVIPNKWTRDDDGVWQVDFKGTGPDEWNFRQLFVDGKCATRARFPNTDAPNPFLYATGGDMDHAIIDPALVKASWGRARDAQINIVPQWRFFNQWNTVTKVDTMTGRIDITDSERHAKVIPGNWFWIEGVREELDQPGEWFLDTETRRLHYMPPAGVDPNQQTIIAPVLNRLINAKGDVNAGIHVQHVHFDGIEFRHTTFTLGHIEARVHTDTVIMFGNTLDCSVRNCLFENIGGYALWLHLDSRRNKFDRNTVRHSGGGGVHLDSRPFSMSMEPGNLISHNYFNDLSRNGVFAFRNQGGNVVEYNHIHNAMQTTIDGACIHFATMNHLNAPNFILNNWLHDAWGYEQKPDGKPIRKLGNGIFLDWDTSNTTVRDNWVYNTVGGAIKPIWKNQNLVIENNRESDTRIVPPFVNDLGPEGKATNGIDLSSNRLIGSVIHSKDDKHVVTTGKWEPKTVNGMWGLFRFDYLVGTAAVPSEVTYTLPIPEDGVYQICLLYPSGKDRASNVPITIQHADGEAKLKWDMQKGSKNGFAVEVGKYRFLAGKKNTVTLSTRDADGNVIADSVAFVKVKSGTP